MTTSGSVNYSNTRNEIIQEAYGILGVYGVGRTVSAEDMDTANKALNMMVKSYQADGLHLWTKEEAYLFLADNTGEYTLSADSSSARACLRSDAVITEISTAAAAAATSLTVENTTGMTVGDFIGIVGDADAVTWTTISTIPTSTTLTIGTGLSEAAAVGNNVYTFTSRINKPMRILSLRRVSGGPDAPSASTVAAMSHEEFFDIPNKLTNGTPTAFYYNPDLTTGKLHLWPRPDDPEVYIEFTFERMLEDFDAAGDSADFPSEWLECLTWQLAVRLAPKFGKLNMLQMIKPMADEFYQKALSFDVETTSVKFSNDKYGY